MKITKIETFDIRVPLERVSTDAVNLTDSWGFATIRIHTDEGIVGTGYTGVARGLGNDLVLATISNHFDTILLGADPLDRDTMWKKLYWSPVHWVGRAGVTHMALAAVDIALWDIYAQLQGLPLCDLLGGSDASSFPTYNTNGGWLSFSLKELIDNAKATINDGFTGVKIKLGLPDGVDDIRRVEAVRGALGPGIDLMVDVNQAWTLDHALRWGKELAQFGVKWLEEPMAPDDWMSHAELAAAIETPIALGEHVYSEGAFSDFLRAGAVHFVQPDVTRVAGVTEFARVATLASDAGLPVCPHAGDMMQVHQHLIFTTPAAHVFEHIPWGRELFVEPASIVDGALVRPRSPGAGTAMKDDVVEKYLVGPVVTRS